MFQVIVNARFNQTRNQLIMAKPAKQDSVQELQPISNEQRAFGLGPLAAITATQKLDILLYSSTPVFLFLSLL
mgnify:CR=1 FL=1